MAAQIPSSNQARPSGTRVAVVAAARESRHHLRHEKTNNQGAELPPRPQIDR
jgi:hypothetical protein